MFSGRGALVKSDGKGVTVRKHMQSGSNFGRLNPEETGGRGSERHWEKPYAHLLVISV